jgi:hypothetical protein
MDKNIDFSRKLIKGKIAEIIFERMFTESGKFTILRSGYEYTYPELAQYPQLKFVEDYLEKIRHNPDFVLITRDRKQAYIVEVKYRAIPDSKEIIGIAQRTNSLQDPSFLFVASPKGFYFDLCSRILNSSGLMDELPGRWIKNDIQDKYLKLMNEFKLNN